MKEPNGDYLLDDSDAWIPVYGPVCTFCRHQHSDPSRTCEALPEGIPLEMWMGDNQHTSPFLGDIGITFELSDTVLRQVAMKNSLPRPVLKGQKSCDTYGGTNVGTFRCTRGQ